MAKRSIVLCHYTHVHLSSKFILLEIGLQNACRSVCHLYNQNKDSGVNLNVLTLQFSPSAQPLEVKGRQITCYTTLKETFRTPLCIKYIAFFHRCKNDNFHMKKKNVIFLSYFCFKHILWVHASVPTRSMF